MDTNRQQPPPPRTSAPPDVIAIFYDELPPDSGTVVQPLAPPPPGGAPWEVNLTRAGPVRDLLVPQVLLSTITRTWAPVLRFEFPGTGLFL